MQSRGDVGPDTAFRQCGECFKPDLHHIRQGSQRKLELCRVCHVSTLHVLKFPRGDLLLLTKVESQSLNVPGQTPLGLPALRHRRLRVHHLVRDGAAVRHALPERGARQDDGGG